jgi:hypothetical protein
MSASASRSQQWPERFGLLWWLPAGGKGNGLTDQAWAPVANVPADLVPDLLAELRAARVPAYAAPAAPPRRSSARRAKRRGEGSCHLWVGTSAYSRAEETLRVKLPELVRRSGS